MSEVFPFLISEPEMLLDQFGTHLFLRPVGRIEWKRIIPFYPQFHSHRKIFDSLIFYRSDWGALSASSRWIDAPKNLPTRSTAASRIAASSPKPFSHISSGSRRNQVSWRLA